MNLKQLEVFVHVAELGSFTRAAEFLRIAQPALSRQVRALEVEVRQHLLLRNGRGVVPTEAGRRLLAHARGILHQVERAREDLADTRGAPVGHVALGVPPTVGRVLTVRLVDAFRERYPKATLGISEGLTVNIAEWLAAGRIDVGLLYNPAPTPALETLPLTAEPLYLIGPAQGRAKRGQMGAAVALKDIAGYPLIVPSRPNSVRMLIESRLAEIGARIEVALEIDGIQAILDLVARGHGYAVLSLNAIGDDKERALLLPRPIVKPRLMTRLAIATSAQRPLTPLADALLELLREIAPAALERN
ncbi:MAG: LysR family transcriptional regulator [Burkholderiales bacterium]|nr:LysR family transcriptional regulator [Burkholderiales bacterium]